MDYLCAFSWPYSNSNDGAREFFDKLRAGLGAGKKFPIEKPHQIALVQGRSGVFVAILVLPSTSMDDSMQIFNTLKAWFKECDAPSYQDYEHPSVRGGTIQSSLGTGYIILESMGSIVGPVAQKRTEAVSSAKSIDPAKEESLPSQRESQKSESKRKWWEIWK